MTVQHRTRQSFPATMTVAEFAQHFAARANNRWPDKPRGEQRACEQRRLVRLLRVFLDREPIVADLQPDLLGDFAAWLNRHESAYAQRLCREIFLAFCRFLGTAPRPQRGGKVTRELSEAPDTLWGLCLTRYFPANIRIRSAATCAHYRTSLADFKESLGHEPRPEDLDDEKIARMMKRLLDRGLSAEAVNERRNKIRALWEWCARKRIVQEFPTIRRVKAPKRVPRAWTLEQLRALIAACREEEGDMVKGIDAGDWWTALHFIIWDTSERIGAVLQCRWDWLDAQAGTLLIPAESRKGQDADALYSLSRNTLAMLARLKAAGQELIFPWPRCEAAFYKNYNRILKRAGLPTDRKSKTHRMRRSVASHMQAAGHDASAVLGHSSPKVTKDSYLDPTICGVVRPSDVLPAIGQAEPRLGYKATRGGRRVVTG